MNLNDIENVWNSPGNNLPAEAQRRLAREFTRQMVRRRRFQAVWLVHTFIWLTIITGFALRAIATGKTNPALEWGLFPLLILPWVFTIHFFRRYRRASASQTLGELSVIDSFRAALESSRAERSHLKRVLLLFAIMVPLLVLGMQQLHAVGKIAPRELLSMALFFGALLLLSSAGILARYFGRVLPRQRQLESLLTGLTDQPA